MKHVKTVGIVVVVLLAAWGGFNLVGGVQNLYGDWVFLRQARITTLQNQARQAQQQAAQQKPVPKPAPAPSPEAAVTP